MIIADKNAYDEEFYKFNFKIKDKFIQSENILCDEVNWQLNNSNAILNKGIRNILW